MERISHYEIVRRLGHGGMGEVFEATDLDLGRRVALKFLASHYASDAEAVRRFEREARAAAALHHPRIATVFGFDRTTDRPFIAMELLGGRTLRDAMAAGPLPVADALAIARDVASALAFAHRRGVVHRDIKPENLMFDTEGAVKITDFGLARITDAQRLTTTGATLGTAAYMPPEALMGSASAAASEATREDEAPAAAPGDVFALGVTLHEMLAGTPPFGGDSPLAMLYAIANEPPRSLREACPEVPERSAALIERMLEKDPAARATADDAARELSALTGVPVPTTDRVIRPRSKTSRRRRMAFMLAGALVLAIGVPWLLGMRSAGNERRAVILNNEGHDSLSLGRLEGARERFDSALRLAPHYGEAKLNLAAVLHRLGDDNRAAALYGEVIAANRRRPDLLAAAHYGLGEIDLQASAWPSAIEHLTQAAHLDSSRVEYPNNLGYALAQAGHTDRALATLRDARARFPGEATLLKNVALAWLQAGRFDSAKTAAEEAIRLRPVYPAAWLLKERSEAALGDLAAARASLQTLRTLNAEPGMLAEGEAALRETTPEPVPPPKVPTPASP